MNSFLPESPVPQLALLALSSSLSPGPNNLLIAASGAWFGMRRSLPTLAGMYAGAVLILIAAGLGVSGVFQEFPGLLRLLQFAGAGYLAYLAAGLLRATWCIAPAVAPPGFGRAAVLQLFNAKLWLMSFSTISLCTLRGPEGSAVSVPLIVFFVLMTVPSMLLYLRFGVVLRSLAASGRARTVANRLLASLTAVSAILLLAPVPPEATTVTAAGIIARGAERETGRAENSVRERHAGGYHPDPFTYGCRTPCD